MTISVKYLDLLKRIRDRLQERMLTEQVSEEEKADYNLLCELIAAFDRDREKYKEYNKKAVERYQADPKNAERMREIRRNAMRKYREKKKQKTEQ